MKRLYFRWQTVETDRYVEGLTIVAANVSKVPRVLVLDDRRLCPVNEIKVKVKIANQPSRSCRHTHMALHQL